MLGYYFDPTYILVLIGVVISLLASWGVKNTFAKYNKVRNSSGITAMEVAERILHDAGIYDVGIEQVAGDLTDHYSPNEKVLRLSSTVYHSTSVAAIGVAAHECGHAIQHARGYAPIQVRNAIVPVVNIGQTLSIPLIMLGLVLGATGLINVGIILFSFVLIFQVVTLPVEFNASGRALAILRDRSFLRDEELKGAKAVLTAAALTYVAAVISSALQLLRLVLLSRRRDD